jgi:hypothetical protein
VADNIQLLILVIFAMLILLLTQLRELMRQITRTAEEWHRMREAMMGPRCKDKAGSAEVVERAFGD